VVYTGLHIDSWIKVVVKLKNQRISNVVCVDDDMDDDMDMDTWIWWLAGIISYGMLYVFK